VHPCDDHHIYDNRPMSEIGLSAYTVREVSALLLQRSVYGATFVGSILGSPLPSSILLIFGSSI
jgi:hypothetical protein